MRIRPSSCRHSSRRRLAFESLENRRMLSATVTAVLSGGTLTLTGNKNDAYVEVQGNGTLFGYVITGLNGTKITYGSNTGTSETVGEVTNGLAVNLPGSGSGTQSFELNGGDEEPLFGGFTLSMGNENNTVAIENGTSIVLKASISTGNGNQTIQLGTAGTQGGVAPDVDINGNLSITTGAGNSSVSVFDSVINANMAVNMGNGNNKVVVGSEADTNGFGTDQGQYDVEAGLGISIRLGNGNGNVQIDNTNVGDEGGAGNLTVATGNGNATISIGKENGIGKSDVSLNDGYLYVSTCPGNSNVTVLDTSVGFGEQEEFVKAAVVSPSSLNPGDMAIELGAGNDTVAIGSATNQNPSDIDVQGNAYVDIGSGNATISLQSAFVDGNLEMSHQSGNTAITIGAYDPYTEGSDVYVGGNVTITTGAGNASIAIGGAAENDSAFISGSLSIQTGTGNAAISLTNDDIFGNASITTGSGSATVSLLNDDFFSNLAVTLGSGNGSLTIKGTTVDGTTTLNGGGNGTLYYDGTDNFVGGISYSHFKKVTM
jgi:hypothetical protein